MRQNSRKADLPEVLLQLWLEEHETPLDLWGPNAKLAGPCERLC